jgi:hypothetical protein
MRLTIIFKNGVMIDLKGDWFKIGKNDPLNELKSLEWNEVIQNNPLYIKMDEVVAIFSNEE